MLHLGRSLLALLFALGLSFSVLAQPSIPTGFRHFVEVGGIASTSHRTPFWLRANQFGIVPLSAPAGILRVGTAALWKGDSSRHQPWFVSYGVEGVLNAGRNTRALLPEAYVTAGRGGWYIRAGRKREIIGLGDTLLSSGFYSWSQNALPMTKVQVGTSRFIPIPYTGGLLAFQFLYAHGWVPNTDSTTGAFLHQKAAFGRLGKPNWRVKGYLGVIHHGQFAGTVPFTSRGITQSGRLPSSFRDYLAVVTVSQPKNVENYSPHELLNQVGNHLGSIDFGAEYEGRAMNALFYYQHAYDDKSGVAFVNFPDGLWGLRLKWKGGNRRVFRIDQLTLETLNTMSQSGSQLNINSRMYEGIDDYFNHDQYLNGWTRSGQTIGTPFLTPREEVVPEYYSVSGRRRRYIVNNRVQIGHLALIGSLNTRFSFQAIFTFSRNQGIIWNPFAETVNQYSGAVLLKWLVPGLNQTSVHAVLAVDQGELIPNSIGGRISVQKKI